MLFVDGIRQSKEEKEGLQRQAAGEVEIEGMRDSKSEHGERRAQCKQISVLVQILKVNSNDFYPFGLPARLYTVSRGTKKA